MVRGVRLCREGEEVKAITECLIRSIADLALAQRVSRDTTITLRAF